MEKNSVAILKDLYSSIEKSFGQMEKSLSKFDSMDALEQTTAVKALKTEHDRSKNNITLMRMELSNLTDECNSSAWRSVVDKLQNQIEEYKRQCTQKSNSKKRDESAEEDDYDRSRINKKPMTTQQAFNRGDEILKKDDAAIGKMIKVLHSDKATMQEANIQLKNQKEQLGNVDEDLKEIDYSLKRAGKQIKTMFKIYASDKLIMCLIVVIILLIIGITIVGAIGKSKDTGKIPTDIFNSTTINPIQ